MVGLVSGAMRRSLYPVMVVLAPIGWALLAWGAVLCPLVGGAVIGGVVTGAMVADSGTLLHASGAPAKGAFKVGMRLHRGYAGRRICVGGTAEETQGSLRAVVVPSCASCRSRVLGLAE